MRVLFINQFYKPDVVATGQILADLAERLAQKGGWLHVLCSWRTYSSGDTVLPAKEIINDVSVYRVGATGFGRNKALGRELDCLSFLHVRDVPSFVTAKNGCLCMLNNTNIHCFVRPDASQTEGDTVVSLQTTFWKTSALGFGRV